MRPASSQTRRWSTRSDRPPAITSNLSGTSPEIKLRNHKKSLRNITGNQVVVGFVLCSHVAACGLRAGLQATSNLSINIPEEHRVVAIACVFGLRMMIFPLKNDEISIEKWSFFLLKKENLCSYAGDGRCDQEEAGGRDDIAQEREHPRLCQ